MNSFARSPTAATSRIYYSHAPHNDVSVNDGPHIRRWSHKIIILWYHCVAIAYSIQYSSMLYRCVAQKQ